MSPCVIVTVHSVEKLPPDPSTSSAEAMRLGHRAIASAAVLRLSTGVGSPAAPGQAVMKNGVGKGSDQLTPETVSVTSPASAGTLAGSTVIVGR